MCDSKCVVADPAGELLTPIATIIRMVDRVLETAMAGDQRQTLELVRATADDALAMAHDLLDLARLDADQLALEEQTFFLRATIVETLRPLVPRARLRGIELVHRVH